MPATMEKRTTTERRSGRDRRYTERRNRWLVTSGPVDGDVERRGLLRRQLYRRSLRNRRSRPI